MKPILAAWPAVLVFMHVTFARPAGFPVTPPVLFCVVALPVLLIVGTYRTPHLVSVTAIAIYTLAFGLVTPQPIEFIKSTGLIANCLLMLLVATNVPVPHHDSSGTSVRLFLILVAILALLTLLQALTFNVFGSRLLQSPLGQFSMIGPGGQIYVPSGTAAIKRPNGIFSEPSVAGWFFSFGVAVALTLSLTSRNRFAVLVAALASTAALATFSLSGFVNIVVIAVVFAYVQRSRGPFRLFIFGITLASISVIMVVFIAVGLHERFLELFREGTSLYYRLVAPLRLLADSFVEHPFGHPVGDTSYIEMKNYMINWIAGSTTNIDNTWFLVAFYYGIPGALLSITVFGYAVKLIIRREPTALIVVALILALSETGAGWSFELATLSSYAILLVRAIGLMHTSQLPNSGGQ